LTLDEDDNVLVCDAGNNCIRKDTGSRVVTTVAGCPNHHSRCGGGENFVDENECREARFHHPVALCTFGKYTLVCDNRNNAIRMMADGRVMTLVGRPYQGRRRGVGMSTNNEKDVPEGHAASDGEDDNDDKDDDDSVRGNTTWHFDRPVTIGIDSRGRPLIAEDTDDDSQLCLKEILVSLDWSFVRVVLAGLLKCQAKRSRGEREGQMVGKCEQGCRQWRWWMLLCYASSRCPAHQCHPSNHYKDGVVSTVNTSRFIITSLAPNVRKIQTHTHTYMHAYIHTYIHTNTD